MWLIYTPGQPDDPHQPRPGVVISSDIRNQYRDSVIVVPVFSSGRLGPTRVRLRAGEGGISHDSVVFCDEVTTIDRRFLESGPLGVHVSGHVMDQVLRAVRRALGEFLA